MKPCREPTRSTPDRPAPDVFLHLRIAAQSDSPVGQQARETLNRMGVAVNAAPKG